MNLNVLWDRAGIPLIIIVICLINAYRLLVLKDSGLIRRKDLRPLKESEKEPYCKRAGILLLLFAAFSLEAFGVSYLSAAGSFVVILLGVGIVFYLWNRLEEEYK